MSAVMPLIPDNGVSWVDIHEAAPLFGMTVESIKNAITLDKFPVPTYKLGKRRVIDKDVLKAFFEEQKAEGMRLLKERPVKARAKHR